MNNKNLHAMNNQNKLSARNNNGGYDPRFAYARPPYAYFAASIPTSHPPYNGLLPVPYTTAPATTCQLPMNPTLHPFPPGAYVPGPPVFPVPSFINPPNLSQKIVRQIEYYFSKENLVHDTFLRRNMDMDQGWVALDVVANFPLIKELTNDVQLIKYSILFYSTVLEVEDDNLRRKHGWAEWPLPPLATDSRR